MLLEDLQGVADKLLSHLGVHQAQLYIPPGSLAVDQGIPIGMLIKIFVRRKNDVEGVAKKVEGLMAAVLGGDRVVLSVHLHPGGKDPRVFAEHRIAVERLARDDLRRVARRRDGRLERRPLRNGRFGAGPPADADGIFQESVNRVKRPPLGVAREDDRPADRLDDDSVVTDCLFRLGADAGEQLLRQFPRTDDQEFRLVPGLFLNHPFRENRKVRPRDPVQERRQLIGGGLLNLRRRIGQNNGVVGRAVGAEGQFLRGSLIAEGNGYDHGQKRQDHGKKSVLCHCGS